MNNNPVLRKVGNAASIVLILFVALLVICPSAAHAGYLDAGSGSTLAQLIVAIIAGTKKVWAGILGFIRRPFGGK